MAIRGDITLRAADHAHFEAELRAIEAELRAVRNSQYLWMGSRRPSFDPAL